jgi:DNA (cytosine-5)-methyltransferase 1
MGEKESALTPPAAEIIAARKASGLTKTECAALLHTDYRAWQRWENGERAMHPAFWELFCIKCDANKKPGQCLDTGRVRM